MRLLWRRITSHYAQSLAYQIRLTKLRYRYRPYYALSWLIGDILVRLALLLVPLLLLAWQFINPQKLPAIPEYAGTLNHDFVTQAKIIQQTENPVYITADKTIIIAANHYQLEHGVMNIPTQQQTIRAEHMLITNQRVEGNQKITGNLSDYQFFADSFNYDNHTETLTLQGNSSFKSKNISLNGKNGIVLASKRNKLLVEQPEFLNNQGAKASSRHLEGTFTDQNNDKKLKKLHFSDEFLYNWQDNIITGEQAVLYLTKDFSDADYMIITGNVIAVSGARTIKANEAYLDYANEMVEMCGDTEIITKGGKKISTPCATFSLKKNSQFSMRQNKRLLQ